MRTRLTSHSLLLTLAATAVCCLVGCQHGRVPRTGSPQLLVEALASRNKDPNPKGNPNIESFPDDYDFAADKVVNDAMTKLTALGKGAFPALIKHWGDQRYSYSTMGDSIGLSSMSVGDACRAIMEAHFGFHKIRHRYKLMPSYVRKVIATDPEKWLGTRQAATLEQMQIEALEWTITDEKRIYETFLRKTKPREEWQKQTIVPLQRELDRLQRKVKASD